MSGAVQRVSATRLGRLCTQRGGAAEVAVCARARVRGGWQELTITGVEEERVLPLVHGDEVGVDLAHDIVDREQRAQALAVLVLDVAQVGEVDHRLFRQEGMHRLRAVVPVGAVAREGREPDRVVGVPGGGG
jgi:hypothetical protein